MQGKPCCAWFPLHPFLSAFRTAACGCSLKAQNPFSEPPIRYSFAYSYIGASFGPLLPAATLMLPVQPFIFQNARGRIGPTARCPVPHQYACCRLRCVLASRCRETRSNRLLASGLMSLCPVRGLPAAHDRTPAIAPVAGTPRVSRPDPSVPIRPRPGRCRSSQCARPDVREVA